MNEVKNFNKNIKLNFKNTYKTNFDIEAYLNDINKQIKLDKERYNEKKILKSNYFGIINKPNISYSLKTFNFKKNNSRNNITYSPNNKKTFLSIGDLLCNSIDSNVNNYIKSKNSRTINFDLTNNAKSFSESNSNLSSENINKNKKVFKLNRNANSSNSLFQNNNTFITNAPKINNKEPFIINKYKEMKIPNIIINNFDKNMKKIYKNYSTVTDKDLKYLKKYKYAVLDSVNILKKFNLRKKAKLFEEEKSIKQFFFTNREISRKNIIINLLNSEHNNMEIKASMNQRKISLAKNKLKNNKINFEEYKNSQKKYCKQIEKILFNLERNNRTLIEKAYNLKYDNHIIKEYFQKYLYEINDYRLYGKYINEIMDGDTTRFDKKIFPKISDKILNLDYEKLAKNAIHNYYCFLNENNELETNNKFIKENSFIRQPIKMVEKYKEFQNNIILLIKQKKDIEKDTIELKKENEAKLNYLKKRYFNLLNEYNSLSELYKKDSNACEDIKYEIYKEKNNKFYYLIMDLYEYIRNISGEKKGVIEDNTYSLLNYITFINDNICEIQKEVDDLLVNLNNFEKNDRINFKKVVDNRRDEIKLFKQNLALQKVINRSILIKKMVEINKNKIPFITRKTEAPYHRPKKHKKIVVLNEKQIEKLENEELISYKK